jgi:hypothetical protein
MTTTTDAQVASNGAPQRATLTVTEAEALVYQ